MESGGSRSRDSDRDGRDSLMHVRHLPMEGGGGAFSTNFYNTTTTNYTGHPRSTSMHSLLAQRQMMAEWQNSRMGQVWAGRQMQTPEIAPTSAVGAAGNGPAFGRLHNQERQQGGRGTVSQRPLI